MAKVTKVTVESITRIDDEELEGLVWDNYFAQGLADNLELGEN